MTVYPNTTRVFSSFRGENGDEAFRVTCLFLTGFFLVVLRATNALELPGPTRPDPLKGWRGTVIR